MAPVWLILGMFGFGAFVLGAMALGNWLLGPVNRAAGRLNAPTRFVLTDIVWLMLQLQLVLGLLMMYFRDTIPLRPLLVILGAWCLMVVVLWAASVSVVSRAGITQPLRRATVILVLVPLALAEIMAVPVLLIATAAVLSPDSAFWRAVNVTGGTGTRVATVVAVGFTAVVVAFMLRWLSFWVLSPVMLATDETPVKHG
jgi:hypothetical protein